MADTNDTRRIDSAIEHAARHATSGSPSEARLGEILEDLLRILGADYGLIGRICGASDNVVETVALRGSGINDAKITYELAGTPCDNVTQQGICIYPSGVADQFPLDVMLKNLSIESYAGIPLCDVQGKVVGLLVVLRKHEMEDTAFVRSLLRIYAKRASQEFVRLQDAARSQITRFAMDRVGDEIFIVDQDARIVDTNQTACERLGYSRDELLRLTVADVDPLFPADVWPEHFRQVCERGSMRFETVHRTKSGIDYPVEVVVSHVPIDGIDRVCGVARDISERVRSRLEREKLEHELRHSQKLEAVGTLAGGIAHDFNNVLTAILGHTSAARRDLSDQRAVAEALDTIERVARQGEGIARSLLTFAHKSPPQRQVLNLATLVPETMRMLRRLIPASIRLIEDCPFDEAVPVLADLSQLQQVLMNLTLNARDAMPDGGVIRVSLHVEDGRAVLRVADTGCGMDEQTRGRIFEPFFSTKVRGDGTGLGLAIVHGIVSNHDGQITVDSTKGKGACFTVTLDLSPDEVETQRDVDAAAVTALPPTGVRPTILVAEDNDFVREVIVSTLKSSGYDAIGAKDGRDTLRVFDERGEGIDLAVLDLDMPGATGTECLEAIHSIRPDLPALILSGSDHLAVDAGSNYDAPTLTKPFQMSDLVQRVASVLDESKQGAVKV